LTIYRQAGGTGSLTANYIIPDNITINGGMVEAAYALGGSYVIDANGYLHFNSKYAGDIIITEGELEKR
jgi:hypothetical protein